MNGADLRSPGSRAAASWRSGCAPAPIHCNMAPVRHGIDQEDMRLLGLGVDQYCVNFFSRMLEGRFIRVQPCTGVASVLEWLTQKRDSFDIVLINGKVSGTGGSELLKKISMKMDIPVIIMSGEDRMAMIIGGDVHQLIKPYIKDVLRALWKDAVRKRISMHKDFEQTLNPENCRIIEQQLKDCYDTMTSMGEGNVESPRNMIERKNTELNTCKQDAVPATKKQRLVWTPELDASFVRVVEKLGINRAVPKKIQELMNVPGLTRANIASHLQKYRLKRKKQKEVRHWKTVGLASRPVQPEVTSQESQSQWEMKNTATWNQQQQQMMNHNEWQQPLPSLPDSNANVQMPPPLQSTEPWLTGDTGQQFLSDDDALSVPVPGGNGQTEAKIEEAHNPIPQLLPSPLDFPDSSDAEFWLEDLAYADDLLYTLPRDCELQNSGVQLNGIQPEDTIPYQDDENTIPNMGTISDVQGSVPFANIPVAEAFPSTIVQVQPVSDEHFVMQGQCPGTFPLDQEQGVGTGIYEDGHGFDWLWMLNLPE